MPDLVARFVIPALVLGALVGSAAVLAGRLPDPIAIHWGLSGRPNTHAPWWAWTALSVVLWGAGWTTLIRRSGHQARWAVANIYALGGVLLMVHALLLWANLDRASWAAARHVPGLAIAIPAILVGAVGLGALGWLLAGPDCQPFPRPLPSIGLAPAEQAVWAGSAHNRYLLAAAPLAAVVAVLVTGQRPLIGVALVAVLALGFSSVNVIAGPGGVTVRLGVLGWPRRRIALDEIRAATVIPVAPLAYGGWGWRRRPGRTGVIVRGGEGLDLELSTGRRFVVTVDGAEQAAGLINDLLSRQPPLARITP